jgi:surfactin synthase thioesterase subunit
LKLTLPGWLVRYFCLGKDATERQIDLFKKTVTEVAPKVLTERLRILATIDLRKKLKDIKVPCCYIQAKNDSLVSIIALKDFEEGLKNLKVHKVNGPHFILQAEPKACTEAIYQEHTDQATSVHFISNSK